MPEHQQVLDPDERARAEGQADRRHAGEAREVRDARRRPQNEPGQDPIAGPEPTVAGPPEPADATSPSASILSLGLGIGLVCLLEHLDHSVKVPEHLTAGPDAAAPRRGPADPPDAPDPPRGPPLDPGHARVDRGRRLSQPPRQPARVDRPTRADRDPAGHQRQGRRGEEHDGPEPGRHLRPGRRADPADGRRPPPPQPGRASSSRTTTSRRPAWSTCSGATSPGSGRSSRPTSRTSTSCRPATPATSRSRSSGRLELRQLLIVALRAPLRPRDPRRAGGARAWPTAGCSGRIVDAALLVVRSGSHELRPLQRAKAMLEQSHVAHRRASSSTGCTRTWRTGRATARTRCSATPPIDRRPGPAAVPRRPGSAAVRRPPPRLAAEPAAVRGLQPETPPRC